MENSKESSGESDDQAESGSDDEEEDDDSEEEVVPVKTTPKVKIPGRGRGRPRKPKPGEAGFDENDYVIGDLDDPFAMFFDNIILLTDKDADPICGPFLSLPSRKDYPDYFEDIEKPIALDKIRQKVVKNKYRNLSTMEEDIVLMCNNAREYNVEGSQIYNDATTIMRVARQKRIDIEAQFPDIPENEPERPKKQPRKSRISGGANVAGVPNVGDIESPVRHGNRMQRRIYNAMIGAKDMSGRQICLIFMVKPDPEIYPDYYQVITEPMDMRIIDNKITNNLYPNIEEMMRDVVLMFKNAKQYNEPNSQGRFCLL